MKLIPSIDLRGGRCVRLLHGDFDHETIYDVDPLKLSLRYQSLGAAWMHVVDLDGARNGVLAHRDILGQMARERLLKLQVGGGVRSLSVVDDLLSLGIARVVVGSTAIEHPTEVAKWLQFFGAERVCLAFDVCIDSGEPLVQTRGWTEGTAVSLWNAVESFLPAGLRHVLCTDVGRDGAMTGPSVDLYRECLARYPSVRWQASGGVRDSADLELLRGMGMSAAISGRALLEGRLTDQELQLWMGR